MSLSNRLIDVEFGRALRFGVPAGCRIGIISGGDGSSEVQSLMAISDHRHKTVIVAAYPRDQAWRQMARYASLAFRVFNPSDFEAAMLDANDGRVVFDNASDICISPWAISLLQNRFVWLVCEPESILHRDRGRSVADVLLRAVFKNVAGPVRGAAVRALIVRSSDGVECRGSVPTMHPGHAARVSCPYAIPPPEGAWLRRRLRAIDDVRACDHRVAVLQLLGLCVAYNHIHGAASTRAFGSPDATCMVCLEGLFRDIYAGVPQSRRLREPSVQLVGCCGKSMCATCYVRWCGSTPHAARCPACRAKNLPGRAVVCVASGPITPPTTSGTGIGAELHVFASAGSTTVREIGREDPLAVLLERWGSTSRIDRARAIASPRCVEKALLGLDSTEVNLDRWFERAFVHVWDRRDAIAVIARASRLARSVEVLAHGEKICAFTS